MNKELESSKDYYIDASGLLVFTREYLIKEGTCCGNGCKHCPYDYINVPQPKRSTLLKINNGNK